MDRTPLPFTDADMNEIWTARAMSTTTTKQQELADIDVLEPDPPNRRVAMSHHRFRPLWLAAEAVEWKGLWERGCFKKWKRSDLLPNDRVFTSRYHYKIKRDPKTLKISKFKVRLVVQGHRMKESVDYVDAFAPVPHATVMRLLMALAIGYDMEMHSIDMTQAFIQADRIEEGVNGRVFVTPPPGCEEYEEGVVYEVIRPLYGIPSSARALHLTVDRYLKSEGFESLGFEDSVWVREPGGEYPHRIIFSAHIDDCLILCKDKGTLNKFKFKYLKSFDGTDEGELTRHLGCELVRDRERRTGTLSQSGYAEKILRTYGMWDCKPVTTPLKPGVRLSKKDSPEFVDPALHRRYRGLVGHISFLMAMTRPDLAFAYSEISKFVQYPGAVHMEAAKHVLRYIKGTVNNSITYSDVGDNRRGVLSAWVDSDYAADPDT